MTLDEYPNRVPPEYRTPPEFFESDVEFPRFENVAPKLGLNTFSLSGGAIADDFDQGGKRFANVTMAGGFGHLPKGHDVSFADVDNDGDQDVCVQMGGSYVGDKFNDALFGNPGFGKHWISIVLVGCRSNRSAIGARIHMEIIENGKPRSVFRQVNSGGSFGCNPLRQYIGLGKAERIESVQIYWPTTDRTQTFYDLAMDQWVRIVEDEKQVEIAHLEPYALGGK